MLTGSDSTVPSSIAPSLPFMPSLPKEQEIDILEQHMQVLKTQLDTITKRLDELKD
jgi:hypothetical protein